MNEVEKVKEFILSDWFINRFLVLEGFMVVACIALWLLAPAPDQNSPDSAPGKASLTTEENAERLMALEHILVCLDPNSSDLAFASLQQAIAILDGPLDSISTEKKNSPDCDIQIYEKYVFELDHNEQTLNTSESHAIPRDSKIVLNKFLYKDNITYCDITVPIHEILHLLLAELHNYPGAMSDDKFHSGITDEIMSQYCNEWPGKPDPKLSPKEFFYIRSAQKHARNNTKKK
jgi:hypothetical protein